MYAYDARRSRRCGVGTTVTSELDEIVRVVAEHPGLLAKTEIGLVGEVLGETDWTSGPGDDGAVVRTSTGSVVACGEAPRPPFGAHDPPRAGCADAPANVNDGVARGAEPLGIVNTVAASEETARAALEGMRHA